MDIKTATPPSSHSLRCLGVDIAPENVGFFRETAPDTPADELRTRMEADGYLFVRGLLDRKAVSEVRLNVLNKLDSEGLLDRSKPLEEGWAAPGAEVKWRPDLAEGNEGLKSILYGEGMLSFMEKMLGGTPRHFDYTWFRTMSRGQGTASHCDLVYMGRGTQQLYTAWVPYGDTPIDLGGLMLLEGSHRKSDRIRNYLEVDVDSVCTNRPAPSRELPNGWRHDGVLSKNADTLVQKLGGRWLTAEYRMGDVLIFGMTTVHAGMDNQTDRLRISSDSRYQLASEPADPRWIGENPPGHGPQSRRELIC